MNDVPVVAFEGVDFAYPNSEPLFQGLSLSLHPGRFHLLKGPSGTGKSTLLRLVNRLEEPTAGRIFFKGRPLADYSPPHLRRSILYIQQTPTVFDGSVRDNLLLPFTFRNNKDLARPGDERLESLMNDFLLAGLKLADNAQVLSVGQKQRLCFIRGLLLSPEVLLLDEPTSALDEESGRVVEEAAEDYCDSGLTVLMISHKKLNLRQISPRALSLAGGRIEAN